MRLLDTFTGKFKEFKDTNATPYAILSHVWRSDGEQSYDAIRKIHPSSSVAESSSSLRMPSMPSLLRRCLPSQAYALPASSSRSPSLASSVFNDPRISEKIRRACAIARSHGYRYIWIDSCCIDRSSSAELSEAINSMFIWYRDANICYTYMADVPSDADPYAADSLFSRSTWFTRGWTLQELIAPHTLVFLSQDWTVLGTRASLSKVVENITGVDEAILAHRQGLDEISVARRMSWAAGRETTRVEDEAYSLLGIFDINMPTLYGEGRRAFMRLQEEILKRIPDQSIFAWGGVCRLSRFPKNESIGVLPYQASLFAPSPASFMDCGRVGSIPHGVLAARLGAHLNDLPLPEYTISPYGIRTQFPLVSLAESCRLPRAVIPDSFHTWYLAILACDLPNGDLLALMCYPDHSGADITLKSGCFYSRHSRLSSCRLLALSQHDTLKLSDVNIETVYIDAVHHSNLPHSSCAPKLPPADSLDRATIALAGWSSAELRMRGYTVKQNGPICLLCDGKAHIVVAVRSWSFPPNTDPNLKRIARCTNTHSVVATLELWPSQNEECTQERAEFEACDGTPSTISVSVRVLPIIPLLLMEITITEGKL